jgi:hypothetical protein
MPTPPKDPALQKQSLLIRIVESNLKVAFLDTTELRFRGSLLRCAEATLPLLTPTQTTRLYEAASDVKFPSTEVAEFRKKLELILAKSLDLTQFKSPRPTRREPTKA